MWEDPGTSPYSVQSWMFASWASVTMSQQISASLLPPQGEGGRNTSKFVFCSQFSDPPRGSECFYLLAKDRIGLSCDICCWIDCQHWLFRLTNEEWSPGQNNGELPVLFWNCTQEWITAFRVEVKFGLWKTSYEWEIVKFKFCIFFNVVCECVYYTLLNISLLWLMRKLQWSLK